MSKEERKKYRKKQSQAAERKEKEEALEKEETERKVKEAAEAAKKDGAKKKAPSTKKEDPDPVGDALMKTQDPLKVGGLYSCWNSIDPTPESADFNP
jgi:hypothetical protein